MWGHCGSDYFYCSSDKGFCQGGPCKDYSGQAVAQAATPNNGTSIVDNKFDYARYSELKSALGAKAYNAR